MLEITVPGRELYFENTDTIEYFPEIKLKLEHSLLSISKWESKWKKPFLDNDVKRTREELCDYVRCMTITQSVPPITYSLLTPENMKAIEDYLEDSQTATWFSEEEKSKSKSSKKVTSELIYYWMSCHNLPFDVCEKWPLNRLITLIEVCNLENQPKKNMPKSAVHKQNRSLNAARRRKYNSKG